MARIPESFIEGLLDKVDIVDVVSEYVQLKKAGSKYVGLCPFHNERTGSFTVDGDKQLFYCFGCHVGGNLIGFLEKKENLTFIETVEELAKRANVPMPEMEKGGAPTVSRERRASIFEANKAAARFYFNTLFEPEGAEGLEYLRARGLTDNIIRRFGLGYAPDARDALLKHLREKGFQDEVLLEAGLVQKNDYGFRDNFRTRVMFPIIAPGGEILGFGGRVLDHSQPKYLNTGDTPVFNKRKNLYALNLLKKSGKNRAIIGEGYMDVIALNAAGFDYAVASLGTAVTPEQIKLLKRNSHEIFLCYDGDKAGISATHKAIDLCRAEEIKPRIIALPLGVDPDEYIKEYGAESFAGMMKKAVSAIDYLLTEAENGVDMAAEEGRAEYAKAAVEIIRKYVLDSIEVEMYLKKVHRASGFSMETLYDSLGARPGTGERRASSPLPAQGLVKKFESANERAMLAVLLDHPEFRPEAKKLVGEEFFASVYRRVFQRVMQEDKPTLSGLLQSFDGDEEACAALSAVGIEQTVFGDPRSYFLDCATRLKADYLGRQREELKARLNSLATGGSAEKEELAETMRRITAIDKEIRQLRY